MKLFKNTLLFGGLVALATSLSAESNLLTFNAPFEFVAGGNVMPAGNYSIEAPTMHGVLLLRGSQPNSTAMVLAVNAGSSNSTHAGVTFSRRGSETVLSHITIPGNTSYSIVTSEHKTSAAVKVALPLK
jgi:hypothetical protein